MTATTRYYFWCNCKSVFQHPHTHTQIYICQNAHSHTRLLAHQDDADIDEPYNPSGHHLGSGGLGKGLDFSRVHFLIPPLNFCSWGAAIFYSYCWWSTGQVSQVWWV